MTEFLTELHTELLTELLTELHTEFITESTTELVNEFLTELPSFIWYIFSWSDDGVKYIIWY